MKIYVEERSLQILQSDVLVAGSVGEYTVEFTFSDEWDGYSVMSVFKTHTGVLKEVLVADGAVEIPWEVLDEPGYIQIGVYGLRDNAAIRPTVWSSELTVHPGAEQGDPSTPQETTPWQSAVETMGQLVAEAEAAQKAAEEAAESAAHDGGYYLPSVNESTGQLTWEASKDDMPEATSSNVKGPKGDDRVYVGTENPPDGAEVWIDLAGEGDPYLTVDENGDATFTVGTFEVDADGNAVLY